MRIKVLLVFLFTLNLFILFLPLYFLRYFFQKEKMAFNYINNNEVQGLIGAFANQPILVNPEIIARFVQQFVTTGSKRSVVTVDDLEIIAPNTFAANSFSTLKEAIDNGTKFFDAVYYFSLAPANRPAITKLDEIETEKYTSTQELSLALFCLYFWLLTRGNVPTITNGQQNQPTPNFLTSILAAPQNQALFLNRLASFDLMKIDHRWIKYIDSTPLGQEAKNRFGLGVAGYRLLDALVNNQPDNNPDQDVLNAIQSLRILYQKGPLWDVHPITRTATFLTIVKSLNKNLDNLISLAFTANKIDQMVTSKRLFRAPTYDNKYEEWKTWNDQTFAQFDDQIFRH
jgi:hypothetical protein